MNIVLDGHQFVLAAGTSVSRSPVIEWTQNIRLDGQQKRKDRSFLSAFALDRWSGGLGIERMNVDIASDQYRLWDAENVDTRFPSQIVLSPAFNTCTIVPSRGDLALAFSHSDGQLYFVETQRANAGVSPSYFADPGYAYQFTPPNVLGSYSRLFSATGVLAGGGVVIKIGSISAVKSFGLNIVAVVCGSTIGDAAPVPTAPQSNYYCLANSLGGLITGSGYLGNQTNIGNENIVRFGNFVNFNEAPYMVEARANNVGLWTANTALGALTQRASLPVTIGSYLSPLVTDGVKVYAHLPLGIYDFDITPSVLISTERARDKNGAQVMFNNDLFFKNKYSLMKYDGTDITSQGYDLEDGLPADKFGEITAMTSSWRNIFASVKGATYSHILSRENNGAWQYYARVPSPGVWVREMFLSDSPDAIDRLWCIFGNANNPGYFLNPMVNPLQAGTYSYVPTGHFTHPIYDGGMAEQTGGFFNASVIGKALGGSNNITLFYGLNGANPTTQLGIIATNTGNLTFGSPVGIEGYTIQQKFQLAGAVSGTTPVFRSSNLNYLKDPTKRDMFDFTIDYRETARAFGLPIEGLIATMDAIRNTKPLLPFHYGLVATKYVKVLDAPGDEQVEDDKITGGNREGMIKLRLVEMAV